MSPRHVPESSVEQGAPRILAANTDAAQSDSDDRIRSIGDPALAVASRRINGRGKRALDLILGAAAFAFVLPLTLTIILALRLDGGGRAIQADPKVGRRGKPFEQLRFRLGRQRHGKCGPLGRALARTGLADLPALLNVLVGDLSLVGPPSVDADGLARYGAGRRFYLVARPGLTCPWEQEDVKPANLPALCRDYVLNWRLRRDVAVLRAVLFDGPRPRAS